MAEASKSSSDSSSSDDSEEESRKPKLLKRRNQPKKFTIMSNLVKSQGVAPVSNSKPVIPAQNIAQQPMVGGNKMLRRKPTSMPKQPPVEHLIKPALIPALRIAEPLDTSTSLSHDNELFSRDDVEGQDHTRPQVDLVSCTHSVSDELVGAVDETNISSVNAGGQSQIVIGASLKSLDQPTTWNSNSSNNPATILQNGNGVGKEKEAIRPPQVLKRRGLLQKKSKGSSDQSSEESSDESDSEILSGKSKPKSKPKTKVIPKATVLRAKNAATNTNITENQDVEAQKPLESKKKMVSKKKSHGTDTQDGSLALTASPKKLSKKRERTTKKNTVDGEEKVTAKKGPTSILPKSFGAATPYTCYDLYLPKEDQGLGIKLKNIDEKAVVRGFAPWRIGQYHNSLKTTPSTQSSESNATMDPSSSSTASKNKRRKMPASSSSSSPPKTTETTSPSHGEGLSATREVTTIFIGSSEVRVNDVIVSVNNFDARFEAFDIVINKLKSVLSDLVCIRLARPIIDDQVIETCKADMLVADRKKKEKAALQLQLELKKMNDELLKSVKNKNNMGDLKSDEEDGGNRKKKKKVKKNSFSNLLNAIDSEEDGENDGGDMSYGEDNLLVQHNSNNTTFDSLNSLVRVPEPATSV